MLSIVNHMSVRDCGGNLVQLKSKLAFCSGAELSLLRRMFHRCVISLRDGLDDSTYPDMSKWDEVQSTYGVNKEKDFATCQTLWRLWLEVWPAVADAEHVTHCFEKRPRVLLQPVRVLTTEKFHERIQMGSANSIKDRSSSLSMTNFVFQFWDLLIKCLFQFVQPRSIYLSFYL